LGDLTPDSDQEPDIEEVLGLRTDGRQRAWRGWRKRLVVVALVAAGVASLLLWLSSGQNSPVRYLTQPVTREDITVVVTATGSVQPTNQVEVSSELSGTVRKVNVDHNSVVQVGQQLAELDTDKLEATVASSRARLVAARARVEDAVATVREKELEHERQKELAGRRVGTDRDLEVAAAAHDRARASLESARADVLVAEAELRLNETNLAKACICSPIDGVVLSRNVDPGQTVASSLQAPVLFTLAEDLRQVEIQVDVDEADVGQVAEGQAATFTVDAYPERRFDARIRELRFGSEVVQGVVTYKAVLETDNPELLLRPGMTATAEIVVDRVQDVVTVPNAALRFTPPARESESERGFLGRLIPGMPRFRPPSEPDPVGPDRTLWVLRDGVPQALAVKVGVTDGRRTQVLDAELVPGQEVVVDSSSGSQ
jgi:HlyD family secretion protein